MSDSTTPRPRMTALTRRQIATAEVPPYVKYGRTPAAAPGLVIAAPANTALVSIRLLVPGGAVRHDGEGPRAGDGPTRRLCVGLGPDLLQLCRPSPPVGSRRDLIGAWHRPD